VCVCVCQVVVHHTEVVPNVHKTDPGVCDREGVRLCVCLCVREGERETRKRERVRVCVCVCVQVCVCVCVWSWCITQRESPLYTKRTHVCSWVVLCTVATTSAWSPLYTRGSVFCTVATRFVYSVQWQLVLCTVYSGDSFCVVLCTVATTSAWTHVCVCERDCVYLCVCLCV